MTAAWNSGGDTEAERTYAEVRYEQFQESRSLHCFMAIAGVLMWPVALPLALLSRLSDVIFRSCSELLALVPYFPGVILRYEFYRFSLAGCGRNVVIESGAVFIYRNIRIGDHVLVGRQAIIHDCEIGSYVLIGERCTILSGARQHRFGTRVRPMALQGGERRRTRIGDDAWIGSHAIVMEDIGTGAIVAAGAVVLDPVEGFSIVGGVPARVIGQRPQDIT